MASGGVVEIRDFALARRGDRADLFDIAVTPSSDVLSFVVRNTGYWQLPHWSKREGCR